MEIKRGLSLSFVESWKRKSESSWMERFRSREIILTEGGAREPLFSSFFQSLCIELETHREIAFSFGYVYWPRPLTLTLIPRVTTLRFRFSLLPTLEYTSFITLLLQALRIRWIVAKYVWEISQVSFTIDHFELWNLDRLYFLRFSRSEISPLS